MKDSVAVRRTAHARSLDGTSARAWNPVRVAGGLVLAAWAALFWSLLLTGRDALYLSTRTSWVVPVGAVLLTAAAAGLIVSGRVRSPGHIGTREAWVMGLMGVPVVMVLALPPATLGTFSASKRPGFSSAGFSASLGEAGVGPLTLVDVAAAQYSKAGEQALARRAGEQVDFMGIVTRYADTPAGEFLLTRYIVTCCVADATTAQVRVVNVPPGKFQANDWVEVKGPIYPLGNQVIVNATSVEAVARPDRPYLTP
jgi:putative membrane protein